MWHYILHRHTLPSTYLEFENNFLKNHKDRDGHLSVSYQTVELVKNINILTIFKKTH